MQLGVQLQGQLQTEFWLSGGQRQEAVNLHNEGPRDLWLQAGDTQTRQLVALAADFGAL